MTRQQYFQTTDGYSHQQLLAELQMSLSQNRRAVQDDREFRQDRYGSSTRNTQQDREARREPEQLYRHSTSQLTNTVSSMTQPSGDATSPRDPIYPLSHTLVNFSTHPNNDNCRYKVGTHCNHKSHIPLDDHFVLPDVVRRREHADEEKFERQRGATPREADVVSETRLRKICVAIDKFCGSKTIESRCEAIQNMRSWIIDMEYATISNDRTQDMAMAEVVPRLGQFLCDKNIQGRHQKQLPAYIEEELAILFYKWDRGDWDGNPKRGLIKNGNSLDKGYALRREAKYFGAGQLINGQLWFSRIEMIRDGVHKHSQAGISGDLERGAYSVVMSTDGKQYPDVDMGNVIKYMGTIGKEDAMTLGRASQTKDQQSGRTTNATHGVHVEPLDGTKMLRISLQTGQAVRVIRKFKLDTKAAHQPKIGYRYDGLYQVTAETVMDEARQIWSFRMDRLPGQQPLRRFNRTNAKSPSI